jgi:hypothetical protein
MDDQTFLAFIVNNAPACEVETLRNAVDELNKSIASRVFGRPPGLELGSHIEAVDFRGTYYRYGTIVTLSDRGCVIEPPVGCYTNRISFKKDIVRILDQYEWNRVCFSAELRKKERDEETTREHEELDALRNDVISQRETARRTVMEALNGPVEIFCGAYVHAYRPDWGMHEYGVVIDMTPKKIILSSPDSISGTERIAVAKHEITLLDESQWQRIDAELERRAEAWAKAEENGTTDELPDYCRFEIDLT